MRFDPKEKTFNGKESISAKERTEHITRKIAIIVAFASTFGLFLKVLFF